MAYIRLRLSRILRMTRVKQQSSNRELQWDIMIGTRSMGLASLGKKYFPSDRLRYAAA